MILAEVTVYRGKKADEGAAGEEAVNSIIKRAAKTHL
jgi:hypothetical protein